MALQNEILRNAVQHWIKQNGLISFETTEFLEYRSAKSNAYLFFIRQALEMPICLDRARFICLMQILFKSLYSAFELNSGTRSLIDQTRGIVPTVFQLIENYNTVLYNPDFLNCEECLFKTKETYLKIDDLMDTGKKPLKRSMTQVRNLNAISKEDMADYLQLSKSKFREKMWVFQNPRQAALKLFTTFVDDVISSFPPHYFYERLNELKYEEVETKKLIDFSYSIPMDWMRLFNSFFYPVHKSCSWRFWPFFKAFQFLSAKLVSDQKAEFLKQLHECFQTIEIIPYIDQASGSLFRKNKKTKQIGLYINKPKGSLDNLGRLNKNNAIMEEYIF